jgi:hypothetical protein
MAKFSWREFVVDKLESLPPEELHRIGVTLGLIGTDEELAPGELSTQLMRRAGAGQKARPLVDAVYRRLGLDVPAGQL